MEAGLIKGIDITLYQKTKTGVDPFNAPVFSIVPVTVHNVLVAPVDTQEVLSTLDLTGRRAVYQLGIPKGDKHEWTETEVEFFGKRFRTIGEPIEGIDHLIPLSWNKKVRVEYVR